MKSVLPKIALVLLLIIVAVVLAITVPRMLQPAQTVPADYKYLPMVSSMDTDLIDVLNKASHVEKVSLLTARREAEDKLRITGIADTRERVSEYLGALERIGLRNYVLDIEESVEPTMPGFGFVITGKLTTE